MFNRHIQRRFHFPIDFFTRFSCMDSLKNKSYVILQMHKDCLRLAMLTNVYFTGFDISSCWVDLYRSHKQINPSRVKKKSQISVIRRSYNNPTLVSVYLISLTQNYAHLWNTAKINVPWCDNFLSMAQSIPMACRSINRLIDLTISKLLKKFIL